MTLNTGVVAPKKCARLAKRMKDADTRRIMLGIASDYERLRNAPRSARMARKCQTEPHACGVVDVARGWPRGTGWEGMPRRWRMKPLSNVSHYYM